MKKGIIFILLLLIIVGALYIYREPIIDFLPIDQSRWITQDGKRYLLDEDGDPRTGWVDYEGSRYYLDDTGVVYTGWMEMDGSKYYLDAAGRVYSGWLNMFGERFYLNEDGHLCYGWLQLGEKRYFLNESNGHLLTGWLEENGQRYYLDEIDGHMVTGWVETHDGLFYMNPDGTLATGVTNADGELYYFDENGLPIGGWAETAAGKHYFGEDGRPCSGWLEYEGNTYYLLADGIPAVGKLVIEDQTYFFTSTGKNFMLVNLWNLLPEDFEVEPENHLSTWLDPVCRDALEQMLSDCTDAGFKPKIVTGFRSVADQEINLRHMIYYYLELEYSYTLAYHYATQAVAIPKTSEHHLGLAFDIVDASYPYVNNRQAQLPIHQWLKDNCWKYGFIQRYPDNSEEITGSICRQWHYRYVGPELAQEIHELGDITLEEYIDNLTADGTTCGGKAPSDK